MLFRIILYALVSVLGPFAFAPLLKKQIALAEGPGPGAAEYRRASGSRVEVEGEDARLFRTPGAKRDEAEPLSGES